MDPAGKYVPNRVKPLLAVNVTTPAPVKLGRLDGAVAVNVTPAAGPPKFTFTPGLPGVPGIRTRGRAMLARDGLPSASPNMLGAKQAPPSGQAFVAARTDSVPSGAA